MLFFYAQIYGGINIWIIYSYARTVKRVLKLLNLMSESLCVRIWNVITEQLALGLCLLKKQNKIKKYLYGGEKQWRARYNAFMNYRKV